MLEIKNLDIEINGRYIVKNLNLVLNKGDKLAVIGEEGNGKSTLLKVIMNVCDYAVVRGQINLKENRVFYLAQTIEKEDLKLKVYDYLFNDLEDYYDKIGDFYKYIELLNFKEDLLESKMETLSGGEKVKAALLKLLLEKADILLLDEPTNDLDIDTLEWLEEFINKIDIPVMYVSHDEVLLSKTANMILHLEQLNDKSEARHTLVKGSYDNYVDARIKKLSKQRQVAFSEKREFEKREAKLKQVMNKVEYQQNTISRADPHGARLLKKKMHSLKAQEKRLDNTILTDIPEAEEEIDFKFTSKALPNSKIVLKLDLDVLKVENKVISKNIKLDVVGNEHICIIGKNGIGKSTLIKLIYENIKNNKDFVVGYMSQSYEDVLKSYDKVLDYVAEKNKESITKARTILGSLNFTKDEMLGNINDLSNGSKAKLILAKLVMMECNVLILDEPTRNVSPLSNPVIRKVLKNFNGAIISISHDRKFIEEVALKIYELTSEGLREIIK